LNYLGDRQQELCGLNQNVLQTVSKGAKIGIDECQHQFVMNRWNCTTFHNSTTVFGGVVGIRELPPTRFVPKPTRAAIYVE
jgi:hypothetical protein